MFTIPVLSLLVAFLAVILGPLLSVYVAKKQIELSLTIAKAQITAPMRQAWVNGLRDLLAEFSSNNLHYFQTGFEDRTENEYLQLTYLQEKIELMLNPDEDDHNDLITIMRQTVGALDPTVASKTFATNYTAMTTLSRKILKREWDRITKTI